jgi:cobalt-zinc-cadmium resistance protein CzcA
VVPTDDLESVQDLVFKQCWKKGASGLRSDPVTGQPVLQIRPDREQLARYGVSAKAVLDIVESLGGKPLGDVLQEPYRFSLAARLPSEVRRSPEKIRELPVLTPTGERVPLDKLAAVEVIEGPSKINREASRRRLTVQCNVENRDVGSFVTEAQRLIKDQVKLPPGRYSLEWGGQFEHLERARNRLLIVVPIALLLIFSLLYVTYNDLRDVLIVFSGVPFACVGGVLALWLREINFSISAGVGFIALAGVSVLNSMVLVTFIRQLRERGLGLNEAIEGAALTRLRPVLMTALVASLGFVPMAVSHGVGAEVQRPLATVVIGGVISSTLLTLLVLPVLYHFFGRKSVPAK